MMYYLKDFLEAQVITLPFCLIPLQPMESNSLEGTNPGEPASDSKVKKSSSKPKSSKKKSQDEAMPLAGDNR